MMPLSRRSAHVLIAATIALIWAPGVLHAQAPDATNEPVETARQALYQAERDHLGRIAAWGGLNVAGGLALALASSRSAHRARWSFGVMSAGWGVVNVGIGAVALATSSMPPADAAALIRAERTFHDVLLVNLGLNVAYASVGATMLVAGYRNVDAAAAWRGYGSSLILQGLGLLVLDGIAFLASRARLSGLLDATVQASLLVQPGALGLTVTW